ncbi:MAG: hypothetical protein HY365_03105 [Candidatus Aenigmarchaeota archaeon]|nr:hypothetical protein [Candidatus Aenigmarchaeota archaeon]
MENKLVVLAMLGMMATAYAHDDDFSRISAGITPETPLWGLDVFLDNIRLSLAGSDEEKAEISMEIAQERLMEMRDSAGKGNLEAVQQSEREHAAVISMAKLKLAALTATSSELDKIAEINERFEKHAASIDDAKLHAQKLKLPEQRKKLLSALLERAGNNTKEIELEIERKENKIRLELEAKGLDNDAINGLFMGAEHSMTEFFREKSIERIAQARSAIADAKEAASALESRINSTAQAEGSAEIEIGDDRIVLRTALDALNGTPSGHAKFEERSDRTKFSVEVEDVNLSNGTKLTVLVNGNATGEITLSLGRGELELDSRNGDSVPDITEGTVVVVTDQQTEVVKGTFSGIGEAKTQFGLSRLSAGLHLIERAEFHLRVAGESFNKSQFGKAAGQATASLRIAMAAENVLLGRAAADDAIEEAGREMEEKVEIRVKPKDGGMEVRVETRRNGIREKAEFTLSESSRDEILDAIADRSSVTREEAGAMIGQDLLVEGEIKSKFEKKLKEQQDSIREKLEELSEKSGSSGRGRGKRICAQVMTQAENPSTGETAEFPTPCDVPEGWKRR